MNALLSVTKYKNSLSELLYRRHPYLMNILIDYDMEQGYLNCYTADALNTTGLMGIKKMAALLRMSAISEDTYSIMLP